MKLDIPYYIRQVLRERRMVHIPGIGTLRLNQTAAGFNDDKTVISPPSLNISFDDSDSEDDALIKYILDTGLLSESKARKKIDEFTRAAFNKLINLDSFFIDGIGTIVKKAGQDKVEFQADVSDLTREFSDLISLNLTPITRIAEQNAAAFESRANPKVEESGSFIPRILLLSLLIIALYFIGMHFYKSYYGHPSIDDTEVQGPTNIQEDADKAEMNEKELQQRYEEIDELIDPLNEKEGENVATPDNELKGLDRTQDTREEGLADDEKARQDKEGSLIDNSEQQKDAASKSIVSAENINTSENKHADIIPESGECIIIVGSFIKSLNAIKMVSLLERKGYKVYQEEYKGFSRVGIKYNCENEDLEAYLQNVRKKISKRAWYLDPDLEVPYLK